MSQASVSLIALAGSPNCGKTALFNSLTRSNQKVGNYPGVTVEKKSGRAWAASGQGFDILDLPGTYSLNPRTPDEAVTRDVLMGRNHMSERPHAMIAVADATNLERTLSLVLELKTLGMPMVLALNMMDLAQQRGLELDVATLSREMGVKVVPTVAVKGLGNAELMQCVETVLASAPAQAAQTWSESSTSDIKKRFAEVDRILSRSIRKATRPSVWTDRIDRVVLHPVWGSLVLVSLLLMMFQGVFNWASTPADWIEAGIAALGAWVSAWMPEGALKSLLVDGIIAGVGSVLVFLPQILLLFLFILILEDSGYMARAAFLMDRIMGRVGLHGRAFIPLLSSYACAIPGIMATRTIENRRDRLTTILVAPLTTCSARLPVYALLIAAFIPNTQVFGFLQMQGLVMLGLYALGLISAIVVAFVLRRTLLNGSTPPLLLELPTYKIPGVRNVLMGLLERARLFVRRAGTIIFSLSIVIWFLASYPGAPEGATEPAINYSYAGRIGHTVEPLFRPIGFDWRIATGLVPGFAAREVMVGALATVYAIEGGDEAETEQALGSRLAASWSLATALSLLVWYVFAPQCLSTVAVMRRETNSWRWPLFSLVYMTVLAYVASWMTYFIASRW